MLSLEEVPKQMNVSQLVQDLWEVRRLPRLEVSLQAERARANDSFYLSLVEEFFRNARRRHRRFPLIRSQTIGVAMCRLPRDFDEYFMQIEAAARRNVKKARRLGYEFRQITYNDHLEDVCEIRRSTSVRQGTLPAEFVNGAVSRCNNPPSLNGAHDYPYFGVLKKDRLYAYAGCFICGEICMLEHIYGHATHQPNGVIPMLIVGIADHLIRERPGVKYFSYGTYFGAGTTMRRFKRKFLFEPHRVNWVLG
ncbi:MAG: hypothetical protein WD894_11710 [Pirellulales bacterium]